MIFHLPLVFIFPLFSVRKIILLIIYLCPDKSTHIPLFSYKNFPVQTFCCYFEFPQNAKNVSRGTCDATYKQENV